MSFGLKIPLERKIHRYERLGTPQPSNGHTELKLSASLPFYQAGPGKYVHRIRYGSIHQYRGTYSHTSFTMWCGLSGHLSPASRGGGRTRPTVTAQAPEGEIFCATCEGRAIGAGLDGSHILNGRLVRFSPRK